MLVGRQPGCRRDASRHKRRSSHNGSRDETHLCSCLIYRLGRERPSAGSSARQRAERDCPSQPPGAYARKLPTTSRAVGVSPQLEKEEDSMKKLAKKVQQFLVS